MSSADRSELEGRMRQRGLERAVRELGFRWAEQFLDELAREGRRAEGPWPGTLVEARSRIDAYLVPDLLSAHMQPPTPAQRKELARGLYTAAARCWSAHCRAQRRRARIAGD